MSIYTHGSALLLRHAFENDEMGLLPLLPFADSRASPAYSRRWSKRDGAREMEQERWSKRDGAREMEQERWSKRDGAREMESKSTIQSDAMS